MHPYNELYLFIAIVEAGSFTKAGERLGISKSALSQSLSNLENRLSIRLLNRSTRSISPTPEGLALYHDIAAQYRQIGAGLEKLVQNQETVSGTVRINASHLAIETVILPKLAPLLAAEALITVELHSDNTLSDVVGQGFDMGVRLGDAVAGDMVAVKISEAVETTLVASREYLSGKTVPKSIRDLDGHRLINVRFAADKAPMAWEFRQGGQTVQYTPKAQVIVSGGVLPAVQNHLGIGFVGKAQVADRLKTGELIEILGDLAMTYEPFYAYYPSRKHHSKAFAKVQDALRVSVLA